MVAKQVRAAYTQEFRLEAVTLGAKRAISDAGVPDAGNLQGQLGQLGATGKSRHPKAWDC